MNERDSIALIAAYALGTVQGLTASLATEAGSNQTRVTLYGKLQLEARELFVRMLSITDNKPGPTAEARGAEGADAE